MLAGRCQIRNIMTLHVIATERVKMRVRKGHGRVKLHVGQVNILTTGFNFHASDPEWNLVFKTSYKNEFIIYFLNLLNGLHCVLIWH